MKSVLAGLRPIPETVTIVMLSTLALTYCKPPPPTHESDVITPQMEACKGTVVDALQTGDRVQIGVSREGRLMVVDFVGGKLEDGGDLVTGGAPTVSTPPGKVCAGGDLDGDACLSALWKKKQCWTMSK